MTTSELAKLIVHTVGQPGAAEKIADLQRDYRLQWNRAVDLALHDFVCSTPKLTLNAHEEATSYQIVYDEVIVDAERIKAANAERKADVEFDYYKCDKCGCTVSFDGGPITGLYTCELCGTTMRGVKKGV